MTVEEKCPKCGNDNFDQSRSDCCGWIGYCHMCETWWIIDSGKIIEDPSKRREKINAKFE